MRASGEARALVIVAGVLGSRAYLTGEKMTLADTALACHLDVLAPTPEGARVLAGEPVLSAFLARMAERPSMADTEISALARRFLPKKK